jgi:response regulator RpfG family c-di-GMP phosphodiesterase
MSHPQAPFSAASRRVLIVDDDDGIRRVLRRILEQRDYQVLDAAGAEAALEVVVSEPDLALVISDIHMPGIDGIWLLGELRRRYPDVGVLMLTGDADLDTAVQCLKIGALDYLSKPMIVAEVQTRVDKAIEKMQMTFEIRRFQERYQADLEQRVGELSRKNQEMFLAQVQMAVQMLEAKDTYTRGHSSRVAKYAVATGRQLGLSGVELEEMRLGGELHDIGKIGTRDAVLNKPGPLTPEEFSEIQRHTIDGERMLSVLRDDHPLVLQIVRWHHERLDGSGFPDGLVGDRIPLPVRIVAVVDAFDAMTSTRAYRSRESVAWATEELQRFCGNHFDGDVVRAFLEAHPTQAHFEDLPIVKAANDT